MGEVGGGHGWFSNDGKAVLAFARFSLYSPIRLVLFSPSAMPKLSLVAAEAERLLGRLPEARRLALQQELVDLCEARWHELRGPEPSTPLAHALWSITPPLVELFADLYTAGDARLDDVLRDHRPAWGLALLGLAEIGRGDAEGARLVHEPMMVFESETAGARLASRMAALLSGRQKELPWHRHAPQPPLWKALALIAAHTRRCDLKAVVEAIRLLADPHTSDEALKALRNALDETGIRFLGADDGRIRFAHHGHEHKPVTTRQVGDTLLEIRQARLG
jgi:hypothetical protein